MILDVDGLVTDATVADIPVGFFGIEVHLTVVGVMGHVGVELALAGMRTALAAFAAEGVVSAVEPQAALRGDPRGRRAGPPVQEVEMVAGLVDLQAAAVGLVAVPAAEVVRAMQAVQGFLELHEEDLAQAAGTHDRIDGSAGGAVAGVVGREHLPFDFFAAARMARQSPPWCRAVFRCRRVCPPAGRRSRTSRDRSRGMR